jgi:hypothetical protein
MGAFSARFRAHQGLAPLSVGAVRRYLSADDICHLGMSLTRDLQELIYRAWCAGDLRHVIDWLGDDPPPDPHGLWARAQLASGSPGIRELE